MLASSLKTFSSWPPFFSLPLLCSELSRKLLVTSIDQEGTRKGYDCCLIAEISTTVKIPVIASGGITNLEDVSRLCAVEDEGIMGAITGRAIYEGTLDFAAAQALADELNGLWG